MHAVAVVSSLASRLLSLTACHPDAPLVIVLKCDCSLTTAFFHPFTVDIPQAIMIGFDTHSLIDDINHNESINASKSSVV